MSDIRNYGLAANAKQVIDETRLLVKQVLHCPSKQVIFTPTATIALNMIIQGMIAAGVRKVYISPFEHNAVTRVLHAYEKKGKVQVVIKDETIWATQKAMAQLFDVGYLPSVNI